MEGSNGITGVTGALAKATLGDGAIPTEITLPNNIKPKAIVTSLTTMFEVVWYRPHRYIWLQYNDKEKAVAACEALHGKLIAGVKFLCDLKEDRRTRTLNFSVKLQGMPQNIDLSDIRPRLPQGEAPDGVAYGNLNYPANTNALQHICDKIRARTSEHIKYRKPIEIKNGVKQKAEIILEAEAANLSAHAKALNGVTIPELGNSKVFFVERLRLYVAVEKELYKRRSKALKGIADRAWNSHHIEVKIFDGELRYEQNSFLVLITGNGREEVKKIKAEIDGCVAADAIKGLQRQAGLPVRKRKVHLNTVREYKKAVDGGGLGRLQKFYGNAAVVFEDESDPPRITITSPDGKVDRAKEVLFRDYAKGTEVGECPICFEENIKLLKTPGCDHVSCESCLDDYCTINASSGHPLTCFSNLECGTLLPIHWLKHHLSPVAYRSLFEGVIAAHCHQDPDSFVRCAGPDCDQHLAVSKQVSKAICPACLTVNCTGCRTQYHFGETCEESQNRRDPQDEALQQYLAGIGGKLCPRCGTPGIRINGCFHIECPGCRTHYCWLCLEHSAEMGNVYAHLERVHGGPHGPEGGPAHLDFEADNEDE